MDPDQINTEHAPESAIAAQLALNLAAAEAVVKEVRIDEEIFYLIPEGKKLESLDRFRTWPTRHKGLHQVDDPESFLKLLGRFEKHSPVVQLCKPSMAVLAVLNFHSDSQPEWGDHRIQLKLGKHRDLLAWEGVCNKPLSQVAFMEFLEDHLTDVTQEGATKESPSQSMLQSVVGDLNVTTDEAFTSTKDLHNGNYVLHTSSKAKPTVEVPQMFHIAVPIFSGDQERYLIPVRLRYRVKDGLLTFTLALAGFDVIFDAAWMRVHEAITAGLPEGIPWFNVPVLEPMPQLS